MTLDSVIGAQIMAGNQASFEAAVATFQPRITTYLLRLVGDLETAKDLTQDTFLRAYQALPDLEEESNLSAWLFTIATNRAMDYLRRRRLIRWLPLLDRQGYARGGEASEPSEEAELVRSTLGKLKPQERAALLRHLHYGFSYEEAGSILRVSEATFRQRLYRARLAFKRAYAALSSDQ